MLSTNEHDVDDLLFVLRGGFEHEQLRALYVFFLFQCRAAFSAAYIINYIDALLRGVYSGQWIFYFPWHRHQIEGTNGFYCLIRKTLASRVNGQSSEAKSFYRSGNRTIESPVTGRRSNLLDHRAPFSNFMLASSNTTRMYVHIIIFFPLLSFLLPYFLHPFSY